MTTPPLFVSDFPTLKAQLRLSGVKVTDDVDDMIHRALLEFRLNLSMRLDAATITTLLATSFDATPDHTDETSLNRALANLLEIKWTRLLLMRTLPTIFMDASGGIQETYNDVSAFRKKEQEELSEEMRQCQVDIETWLSILSGDSSFGTVEVAQIFSTTRQSPQTWPTRTLVSGNDVLYGDFTDVDDATPGVD